MPRTGRPPLGAKLLDSLDGSALAKRRAKAILATLSGEWTTIEATEFLDCNEARFHALRKRTLQEMVQGLEPRAPGRKPKVVDPRDAEITRLRKELDATRTALQTLDVRLQLAAANIGAGAPKAPRQKKRGLLRFPAVRSDRRLVGQLVSSPWAATTGARGPGGEKRRTEGVLGTT